MVKLKRLSLVSETAALPFLVQHAQDLEVNSCRNGAGDAAPAGAHVPKGWEKQQNDIFNLPRISFLLVA